MTKYYKVADHVFSISGCDDIFRLMGNYEPFASNEPPTETPVFQLTVEAGEAVPFEEELQQDDEGQQIICGHNGDGQPVFQYIWADKTAGWLICSEHYSRGRLITTGDYLKLAIDNALMVLFALATADKDTVLFHAAIVSYEEKGYMFLGKSGTGKSTHARLWLKYIEGTALVNDDNPVVRTYADGHATVFGSPWSGKTPCYRNVSYPLGGIVLLSQAPYNKIHRLVGIQAYAALVPSISGKRWDKDIANGLHETENALATHIPCWHLECLPDEEAARVCHQEIRDKR